MALHPVDEDVIPMLNHSTHGPELLAQLNAEESLNRLPLLLVLSILSFVGIFANAHVLFVFGTKIKRSTYRVFVLGLGCIDMLGCTISIPFQIIDETHPYTFFDAISCKIFRFFDTNLAIAAALMLVVIASERFRKICRPNGLQVTEKRAIRSIIAVIVGSSIATSPALLIYGRHTVPIESKHVNGTECSWTDEASDTYYGYVYYAVELFIIISCMVSLTILYSFVGKALRAHNQRMRSTRIVKFHAKKSTILPKYVETKELQDFPEDLELQQRGSIESIKTDRDSGVDSPIPASSDSQESVEIEIQFEVSDDRKLSSHNEDDSVFTNSNKDNMNNIESTSSTCQLCEGSDALQQSSSIRRILTKVAQVPEALRGIILNRRGTSDETGAIPDIIVTDCKNNITHILGRGQSNQTKDRNMTSAHNNDPNLYVDIDAKNSKDKTPSNKSTKRFKKPLTKIFRKRKKSKEAENIRERRITKLLFFITLTFIVTYHPYIIVLVIYAIKPEFKDNLTEEGRVFYLMALRLYLINNVMNAFFYGFFDLEFRNHCKDIYKKLYRKITMSNSQTFVCKKCVLKQNQCV